MEYTENVREANSYREEYLNSLEKLLEQKQAQADAKRAKRAQDIMSDPEKYRKEFCDMLGWPLTERNDQIPAVTRQLLAQEKNCNIYRIQFELPYGLKFYGIFFEQNLSGALPLVIVQHGGLGTPELVSGLLDGGTGNYNDMVERTLPYGVNIFAPQLFLWNQEEVGIKRNREEIDARLKQIGSSITAVEIFCIQKSIDYFQTLACVDRTKIGMIGLSYGGFYTLYTAAVDKRIKAAIACSQYNNRYLYSWEDWTWKNSANLFFDNEVCMLVSPRPIWIEVGKQDELFDCASAEKEYQKLSQTEAGKTVHFRAFEGTHEYYKGDEDWEEFIAYLKWK